MRISHIKTGLTPTPVSSAKVGVHINTKKQRALGGMGVKNKQLPRYFTWHPLVSSNVYFQPTTTQNVLVTGWQSQVAASAEKRRHLRHKSLAGEHCYSSNTECREAEHEAGARDTQQSCQQELLLAHILPLPQTR